MKRIILGYEDWGAEIVPQCFELIETQKGEHLKEGRCHLWAGHIWELVASRKLTVVVKTGPICHGEEVVNYILVAHWVFIIKPEWLPLFK